MKLQNVRVIFGIAVAMPFLLSGCSTTGHQSAKAGLEMSNTARTTPAEHNEDEDWYQPPESAQPLFNLSR
jgi:hypothetical protein